MMELAFQHHSRKGPGTEGHSCVSAERMIKECHLHCQAAWMGHRLLQGQVVDVRKEYMAESEGFSRILSHCSQSSASSEETAANKDSPPVRGCR